MKTPILLIGGGGHCRSCIDVIELTDLYEIVGIVEADDTKVSVEHFTPYPIIGHDSDLPKLLQTTPHCLVTVGQVGNGRVRQRIFEQLKMMEATLPTIISPLAYVSPKAKLGEGTIVMHQSLVNAYAQVGDNCIVNSQSLIEHDVVIENHCHISTGAKLNGEVSIGEASMVGSHATLKQGIEIADDVVVGAGAVVIDQLSVVGTYVGCPARKQS